MGCSRDAAIEDFVRTGQYDMDFALWPGEDFAACSRNAHAALRKALIDAVHARTRHATLPVQLADLNVVAFARAKLAPMVRGLFAHVEQETVLDVLGSSLVFLTPSTVDTAIERMPWLGTAWDIANLYLEGCGVPRLAEDAPCLVGLSDGTSCYVSPEYFSAAGRFDDFVVHEAAHIFHNCKRASIGLRGTRRREWLLEIDFGRRETFAYACEAFSRIRHWAIARDPDACSLMSTNRVRRHRMHTWTRPNTSMSCARPSLPATAGGASWRAAHPRRRRAPWPRPMQGETSRTGTAMTDHVSHDTPTDLAAARSASRMLPRGDLLIIAERAAELVPRARLGALLGDFMRVDALTRTHTPLLSDVQKFHGAALAGKYFEDFRVDSRNFTQRSAGTDAFIAEFNRLTAKCVRAADAAPSDTVRAAFELLFGLLRHIDEAPDDVVFFADGARSGESLRWEKLHSRPRS